MKTSFHYPGAFSSTLRPHSEELVQQKTTTMDATEKGSSALTEDGMLHHVREQAENLMQEEEYDKILHHTMLERDLYRDILSDVLEAVQIVTRTLKRPSSHEQSEAESGISDDGRLSEIKAELSKVSAVAESNDSSPPLNAVGTVIHDLSTASLMLRDNLQITGQEYNAVLDDLTHMNNHATAVTRENEKLESIAEDLQKRNSKLHYQVKRNNMEKKLLVKEIRRLDRIRVDVLAQNEHLRRETMQENMFLSLQLHEHQLVSNAKRYMAVDQTGDVPQDVSSESRRRDKLTDNKCSSVEHVSNSPSGASETPKRTTQPEEQSETRTGTRVPKSEMVAKSPSSVTDWKENTSFCGHELYNLAVPAILPNKVFSI